VNKCHFLGKLTHPIEIEYDQEVAFCFFELEIEEFRKNKGSDKVRDLTYLEFEAWDSAALAIAKYAEEGGLIAVESVARNSEEATYFRVTSFKILK
jgi:single-stranded DNA-binding protein